MTIITISRQYGSGGDEIAERVGQILDYKHFDKRMIIQAAQETGLSEHEITGFSEEETHRVQGFLDRLFNRGTSTTVGHVWRQDIYGTRYSEEVRLSEEVIVTLVQKAVRGAAAAGNLIIIGRGAQVILRDEPGIIHVRIEAPMEERIIRVKDQLRQTEKMDNTDIELRRHAQDRIIERDAASTDYLRRFYNVDWADPLLYHLVINTGKMSIFQAAEIIVATVRQLQPAQPTREPA